MVISHLGMNGFHFFCEVLGRENRATEGEGHKPLYCEPKMTFERLPGENWNLVNKDKKNLRILAKKSNL